MIFHSPPSCRPSAAASVWSLPGRGHLRWEHADRFRGAQRTTPCSQHWLHRFKSERTDVSACPSLPGAVSRPRRRAGDGTVPAARLPLQRASLRARPDTVSSSDPPKGVRLGGSSASDTSIHPSVGISSRTAKKAVRNKIEHKPPKPRPILLAEDPPPAATEGPRLKVNCGAVIGSRWTESSGYFAFHGHSQRWKRRCQERCHLQQRGHRSQFPFLRASADLARNILVTVVHKDHMHARLTFNGKKSLSSFSRSQRTPK